MANKISVILDVVTDKAIGGLRGFKQTLADTDGAFNKTKVAGGAAFDFLKTNAASFALGAGTAIVGFGVKAVMAFQNTALEAGRLRDALGLSAEEASRLAEVASDIGIDVGALESTIGRMNRTAADTPAAFDAIGAAIVRNKDGTVNVNETFLQTVDALGKIPDATVRASAAQRIFGRSWQDISELVGMGADDIRTAMDNVADGKLIDDAEIEKARDTRESLDELKDSVEEVALAAGEALVPALQEVATVLSDVAPAIEKTFKVIGVGVDIIRGSVGKLQQIGFEGGRAIREIFGDDTASVNDELIAAFEASEEEAAEFATAMTAGATSVKEIRDRAAEAGLSLHSTNVIVAEWAKTQDVATEATEATASSIENLTAKMEGGISTSDVAVQAGKALTEQQEAVAEAALEEAAALEELTAKLIDAVESTFNLESANLNLESSYASYQEAVLATTAILTDSEKTDREKEQALRDLRTQEIGLAEEALATSLAYAQEQGAADGSAESAQFQKEKLQQLQAAFPELRDEIQLYINKLNAVPGVIRTRFEITATGATVTPHGDFIGLPAVDENGNPIHRAAGGPVTAGQSYIVGERGTEWFTPAMNGHITPHNALAAGWTGSSGGGGGGGDGVTVVVPVQTWDGEMSPYAVARLVEAINRGIRTGGAQLVTPA